MTKKTDNQAGERTHGTDLVFDRGELLRRGEGIWRSQGYVFKVLRCDDLREFAGGGQPWELIGIDSGGVRRIEVTVDRQFGRLPEIGNMSAVDWEQVISSAPRELRRKLRSALTDADLL